MLFTGLFSFIFDRRLIVGFRNLAMLLLIAVMVFSFDREMDRDQKAKQANILIRQIGNRLLQQSGDSTSRVLPVTEIKAGVFRLSFEREFVFSPDSLMTLTKELLPGAKFASGFMVTVHDCLKGGIVYGFLVNYSSPDVLACRGRKQPLGCYSIEFSFPDFYAGIEGTGSGDTETGEPGRAGDKGGAYSVFYVLAAIFLLGGMAYLAFRPGKKLQPTAAQENTPEPDHRPEQDVPAGTEVQLPSLGKYLFDKDGQYLQSTTETITLTDKECRVLEILHKNFGELITRDTLMQEVWLNEGVITGRSLDMFISKLRKKLSGDPDLAITNIHGKGYRLTWKGAPQITG